MYQILEATQRALACDDRWLVDGDGIGLDGRGQNGECPQTLG